jgi:LDH2 family malate/lactate/ureidoglycolate dehydrogenase
MGKEEIMTQQDIIVDATKLQDFAARALQKVGVPEEDARITADMLVTTDLRGIESHGVAHLAQFYVGGIRGGHINPTPSTRFISESLSTAVMDADRGLGFVVGHRAMNEAIRRAESTGAGFVAVPNSTHSGAGSCYAMMAAARDMVGIAMTTGGNIVIPPGGSKRTYGANVLAVAAPRGDGPPFVLDMATCVVAAGKLEIAARRGQSVPEGWILDPDGRPATDPRAYFAGGGILPLGGTPERGAYKGFGLALVVDILCGLLSGSGASPLLKGSFSQFYGALRIDAFLPVAGFKTLMEAMVQTLKAAPRAEGAGGLGIAGEIEGELERQRRAEGIPLHPAVVQSLRNMAHDLEIEYDL